MNDRELIDLAEDTARLASDIDDRIGMALRTLKARLEELDAGVGYPTTASGADTGGGSRAVSETTPVERVVIARFGTLKRPGVSALRDELEDWALTAHKAAQHLDHLVTQLTRGPSAPPVLCDGRGLEGFAEWGRACTRSADKAGMCSACYQRCRYYRQQHGLTTLRDVA